MELQISDKYFYLFVFRSFSPQKTPRILPLEPFWSLLNRSLWYFEFQLQYSLTYSATCHSPSIEFCAQDPTASYSSASWDAGYFSRLEYLVKSIAFYFPLLQILLFFSISKTLIFHATHQKQNNQLWYLFSQNFLLNERTRNMWNPARDDLRTLHFLSTTTNG